MTKIERFLEINDVKRWTEGKEQGKIEIKILPYLKHIENGFFVEAGAMDGLFMSNTKILEDLGWQGLLIEPSKKAANLCKKNRKARVENCALVSKDYEGKTVMGDFLFDGEYGVGAWSSITRHAYGFFSYGRPMGMTTEVVAKTLKDVLAEHNIKKIDLLSLDVEGYELEVLKGTDLNEVDITFILVEINNKEYKLEDVESYLVGYKNLGNLSNFSKESNPNWDGSHDDYLFQKNA